MLHTVIMAGGSGFRFWPYSRVKKPKQLLKLFSDKSLILETVERLEPLVPKENIHISTNPFLGGLIKKELKGVKYVIEPLPKNTAACIGLSAISIMKEDPEAIMFVETSDHVYKDPAAYLDCIRKAAIAARRDKIVLVGIKPTFAHTGLGYIQFGELFDEDIPDLHHIETFKEKPDLKTAKEFLEDGRYLWNAGLFISKCSVMLEEIRRYMPNLYNGLMKIKESDFDEEVLKEVFENIEGKSIDYGVMERSNNTVVINADMHWDDIGDFLAVQRYHPKDERKNISLCEYEGNATRCILLSQTRKIIANNVTELVVADTEDATLICTKPEILNIKKVVEKIKEAGLDQYLDDYVEDHKKNIISYESDECDIETNGLIVLMGVSELDIKRTDKELIIEGVVQDV